VDAVRDCAGIIIDLRGNPGGVAGMVMGTAGHFLDDTCRSASCGRGPRSCGSRRIRGGSARDGSPVRAVRGPLAILVDEMSASTSEFFAAAGCRASAAPASSGRQAGQALPALMVRLPTEDVLMHVIADFTGPGGVRIEGRGVVPDMLRSGYTGDTGWSMNPAEGPRLLAGGEAVQAADEAAFESTLRTPAVIASATTVERTSLGGQECYKVLLVWHSGRETHDCYGVETGLLVGTMTRQETNMGTLDAVTLYDDYRSFDGVLMASRVTIQVMGVEQVITVDEVAFNEDVDDAVTPPAEIRALQGR
jgi:hypothetical protein